MELEMKFKSVAWKWVVNFLLVVFLVVFALEVVFCVFVHSYYLSEVQRYSKEYSQSIITQLSTIPVENLEAKAREYCESFQYKDRIELQVLDSKGRVIVSTTGFDHTPNSMPDLERAKTNGSKGNWSGKNSTGEKVFCETTLLTDAEGRTVGAVRWVASLTAVNRHVFWICVIAILIGLAILGVILTSGMYFVTSIVSPIRDVSNMARKIAMGDFNSRIEIKENNEIGELCDSINSKVRRMYSY